MPFTGTVPGAKALCPTEPDHLGDYSVDLPDTDFLLTKEHAKLFNAN